MAAFELLLRPSVEKDLKKIPSEDLRKIFARMEALRADPRPPGCVKLSGMEAYRVRQGNYRIIYEIQDAKLIVIVVKIGHRRDVYL
ncbi:type II toxin-antitoxin system RelE/ParE family toxin [Luteolibacter sp. Populi]|uniref:type II toxin-antitoxin system RelE family toxin n=1 Tax=Luteolibacter sp. Populi TaxID=3230487 RepID=UPI003466AC20